MQYFHMQIEDFSSKRLKSSIKNETSGVLILIRIQQLLISRIFFEIFMALSNRPCVSIVVVSQVQRLALQFSKIYPPVHMKFPRQG